MKIRVHSIIASCWCHPERLHIFADGSVIWLHRRDDGTLPSLLYQVTALVLGAWQDDRDPGDVIAGWVDDAR